MEGQKTKNSHQHFPPIKTDKSKTQTIPNADKDLEQQEFSHIAGGNAKCCSHCGNSWTVSSKTEPTLTIRYSNRAPWCSLQWAENVRLQNYLHTDIYSSYTHNCQNLEAAAMSFRRWADKLWSIQTIKPYSVLTQMNHQTMKRPGGDIRACYSVKEGSLRSLTYCGIPTIRHSGKENCGDCEKSVVTRD